MAFIEVRELQKHFRVYKHHRGLRGSLRNLVSREHQIIRAVDGISFAVERGELLGYLGPNGAGKSTTVKMLAGILLPTAGTITTGSLVPWRDRVAHARRIGVVFGQRTNLWWDLPVIESFDLLRHIYKVPQGRFQKNLKNFETLLGLDEFLNTPVRSLSLGQRMRADLAAALLHDPDVIFLDEPTIGLDVLAKERIRGFIKKINIERGATIILTTHDLGDVEKLCRRVMMIDQGHLLFDGTLSDLIARFGGERELVVDFAEEYEDPQVERARIVARDGHRVTYCFAAHEVSASTLIGMLAARYQIADLTVREPKVEDTVRRIYEERLLHPPTVATAIGDSDLP
jgi:ABC-2 type transport system ATP-binding protein